MPGDPTHTRIEALGESAAAEELERMLGGAEFLEAVAAMSFVEFTGTARLDRRTKRLVKRLGPDDIAIIDHRDLDRVSAEELLESGVRVVVNVSPSISGRFPNAGPLDARPRRCPADRRPRDAELFEEVRDGESLVVRGSASSGTAPASRPAAR